MIPFAELSTLPLQERMRPAAIRIYEKLWPGCTVEDLRHSALDIELGIDALIRFKSGQWISIQEKYREHDKLAYGDFTQEYKNAAGTTYESNGEWFKLGAQLYFYGWANKENTDFEKWAILDVFKYKMLVEQRGGLDKIGTLQQNKKHGSASFYAIPMNRLRSAFVYEYKEFLP